MSNIAVRVEDLGKWYRIGERAHYKNVRETFAAIVSAPMSLIHGRHPRNVFSKNGSPSSIWALRHVSFELRQGELLGIMGRNGAGKSTLLKILSQITEPTEGVAEAHGRVRSLLEVGTGFHPELTGRENIYLNGAILGMKKAEINRKFDEIVSFADIERFLETPVKWYSSGMYTRLAFSVAAHLEPDVLVVDEVLAVGDFSFQQKCLGKMSAVGSEGRTVVFVSHNMAAIQRLCDRAILLDNGRLIAEGPVAEVATTYLGKAASAPQQIDFSSGGGDHAIAFSGLEISSACDEETIYPSRGLKLRLKVTSREPVRSTNVTIGIGINTEDGTRVATLLNRFDPDFLWQDFRFGTDDLIVCTVPTLPLRPGVYGLSLYLDINSVISHRLSDCCTFEVQSEDFYESGHLPSSSQGHLLLKQTWAHAPKGSNGTQTGL